MGPELIGPTYFTWLLHFDHLLMDFCLLMQAAFLFTVVGTTGFLGVLAGQLPGVCLFQTYKVIEMKLLSRCLNVTELMEFSGLGFLRAVLTWKYFTGSFGCREHFSWVYPWFFM